MRSLADAISIMPVAEHNISAKYSGDFEALAFEIARRDRAARAASRRG